MLKIIIKLIAVCALVLFILSIIPGIFSVSDLQKNHPPTAPAHLTAGLAVAETEQGEIPLEEGITTKTLEKIKLAKEKIQNMQESYQQSKEKYHQAKEAYQKQKTSLIETKNKIKACKNNIDCLEKKSTLKNGVKMHLEKTIDLIEKSMEKIISKVQESNVMTEEEKNIALTSINELREKLSLQKEQVKLLSENASSTELNAAIKQLKYLWQDTQKAQREVINTLISSKMDHLVNKINIEYKNSLQMRIDQLNEKNLDISALVSLMEDYEAKSADLTKHKEFWKNSPTKENYKLVQEDLKELKSLLRTFLQEYQELKKTFQEKEVNETTVEE